MKSLIQKVIDGEVSPEAADEAADDLVDAFHNGTIESLEDALGLTQAEYTAWAGFSAHIATLARWRIAGWPTLCAVCNRPLGTEHWAIERDEKGQDALIHLECAPDRGGGSSSWPSEADQSELTKLPPRNSPYLRRLQPAEPKTPIRDEEKNGEAKGSGH